MYSNNLHSEKTPTPKDSKELCKFIDVKLLQFLKAFVLNFVILKIHSLLYQEKKELF